MTRHVWSTAASATLLLSSVILAFAQDYALQRINTDCSEPKPFREVAQDETAIIAELCAAPDGDVRSDRPVTAAGSGSDPGRRASTRDIVGEQTSPAKRAPFDDRVPR
jgi:hypothetical protein